MRCWFAILLVTATLIATRAPADVFLGVKAGSMDVNVSGAGNATNAGLTLSYDLDVLHADLGVAAEITRTADAGETRDGGDVEVETNALYLTFKTPGTVYFKLRGGLMEEFVTTGNGSHRETGMSLGSGLGVNIGRVRAAIEYTTGAETADYLSFGVKFLIAGAGR
jgi:hypothetical protein